MKDLVAVVEEVLSTISEFLEILGQECGVDKKNTKLTEQAMFIGMIMNILHNRPMTLRGLFEFKL